jgi:uracil-DNA glycosylase
MSLFEVIAEKARACTVCQHDLNHPVRPIVQGRSTAVIRIIGQAPGTRVQESGRPFTDPSGDRLRFWLNLNEADFYDPSKVAITPMGLCFPGLDAKGADKPPRKECVPLWQDQFTGALPKVGLTILAGQYAMASKRTSVEIA